MLVCLLLGITKGDHWGWTSPRTLVTFASTVALSALWIPWEMRAGHLLVDVRTSTGRPVLLTNIASLPLGFAMYCNMLSTTQILQMPTVTDYGFGLTVVQAGALMLPAALMMVLMAPVSATITRQFGAKMTLGIGASVLAGGYLLRIVFLSQVWQIVAGAMIVSSGTAIAYAAMRVLIMRAVPVIETAAANGLNTVLRSIGTSTASAADGGSLLCRELVSCTAGPPTGRVDAAHFREHPQAHGIGHLRPGHDLDRAIGLRSSRVRPAIGAKECLNGGQVSCRTALRPLWERSFGDICSHRTEHSRPRGRMTPATPATGDGGAGTSASEDRCRTLLHST